MYVAHGQRPPNPRLQRTRSRAPLSRMPLGNARYHPAHGLRIWAALLACWLAAASSSHAQAQSSARYQEIRHAIKANLRLNLHCWCWAYDAVSRKAVRELIRPSPADVPLLRELARDRKDQIGIGAVDLLEMVGEPALQALQEIARASSAAGTAARLAIAEHSHDSSPTR